MSLSYSRSYNLAASSANNIAQSQTPVGAGPLTLNGSAVSNGVAILDTVGRFVLLTFAANETGHNFTVTGTNSDGVTQSEVIAGTGIGTVDSVLNYATVTSIVISAAATGAITAGTASAAPGAGATPWLMLDPARQPLNATIEVIVTGTVNYTVQYTVDAFWNFPVVPANAFNHATLVTLTASNSGTILFPVTGIRLLVNSYTTGYTASIGYVYGGP